MHENSQGTPPENGCITVEGTKIKVGPGIKYLGLLIDDRWRFRQHFAQLTPRLERVASALSRLLPNIGGPKTSVRKLYVNVLHSMLLYGAPIWADRIREDRWILTLVHRTQRIMAIRVARCYRTVSYRAATTLSGTPPVELLAKMHQQVYRRVKTLREQAGLMGVAQREIAIIRLQARRRMHIQWQRYLPDDQESGRRVVEAVLPQLESWVERSKGGITFHMAQILTDHGCFGGYLRKIGREESGRCHHCTNGLDSADHTLARCPAWDEERQGLIEVVGNDLTIRALIKKILEKEEAWQSFANFCGSVMRKKEDAERVRQGQQPAPDRCEERRENRPGHGGHAVSHDTPGTSRNIRALSSQGTATDTDS